MKYAIELLKRELHKELNLSKVHFTDIPADKTQKFAVIDSERLAGKRVDDLTKAIAVLVNHSLPDVPVNKDDVKDYLKRKP